MDLQKKKYLEKKFVERFLFHIRSVQDNMLNLENNRNKLPFKIHKNYIINRSMKHDIDKFSTNMVNDYFELFSKKHYKSFDNEYNKLVKLSDRHYQAKRHHFYRNSMIPNNLDLCEMCSDLDAIYLENNEESNKFFYLNRMIKEYPNLLEYNDNILKILDLLENSRKNNQENNYTIRQLQNIRKIQDYMVYLDLNLENLPFKIKKWTLINRAMHFGINYDFTKISRKIHITTINICEICCAFIVNNPEDKFECLFKYFTKNKNLEPYIEPAQKVFYILKK